MRSSPPDRPTSGQPAAPRSGPCHGDSASRGPGRTPRRPPLFAPIPPFKTYDLGLPPIIPESRVLDGGFGAKMATRGGYVRGPGGPNRHDRGPIWGPPDVRKSEISPGECSTLLGKLPCAAARCRWIPPARPNGGRREVGHSAPYKQTNKKKRRRNPAPSYIFLERQSKKMDILQCAPLWADAPDICAGLPRRSWLTPTLGAACVRFSSSWRPR